jgi:hypothetical protein
MKFKVIQFIFLFPGMSNSTKKFVLLNPESNYPCQTLYVYYTSLIIQGVAPLIICLKPEMAFLNSSIIPSLAKLQSRY